MKSRKFIDTTKAFVQSGNGGSGSASFRREKFVPRGGPDGGDGGRGGHVIFRGSNNEDSLERLYFQPHQTAENGGHGRGQRRAGKNGTDLVVDVPCGTVISDYVTRKFIAEILEDGEEFIVAKGGKGGWGNCHWKSSVNQAPTRFTEGEEGVKLEIHLELKLIADAGLVGMPNAGKSTLLSSISRARPKTASYPFTTLQPVIGTVLTKYHSYYRVVDIPGLIKGSHDGAGLGHDFLKHVERTKIIVYVIDMAGTEGREPFEDYLMIKRELELFNKDIVERPAIVVANKMDLPEAEAHLEKFVNETHIRPIPISALDGNGIDMLKDELFNTIRELNSAEE
ncbi:MAG: GTPase ObgE [Lentisphaerae bacterium]|nr:GTPase ObgE [Lentisphaerota bacterium]